MPGSGTPSRDEIIDALRQSGYLMEQEVATRLESLGFHVQTNRAFEDKDEGKSREIDVQAQKRIAYNKEKKLSAYVELLIECKNNSNPYVFVGRPKNVTDNRVEPLEYIFPLSDYESTKRINANQSHIQQKKAFFYLGFDKIHYNYVGTTKAVQFCRIDRNGKNWHANHSGLYDATFYPMAKALLARQGELPRHSSDWSYFHFFVPMVVVSGDLFYVDSTEALPDPESRPFVNFRRELKSKSIKGVFSLDFVTQAHLDEFVNDQIGPITEKLRELTNNASDFVLKKDFPWTEEPQRS